MGDETLASLHDARQAGQAVKTFVAGHSFAEYAADELLRSAVERKFEIMGEALNRIRRSDPPMLEQIRDHREIISFRNILIHGYDAIDNRIVWGIIVEDLDGLVEDLDQLLG